MPSNLNPFDQIMFLEEERMKLYDNLLTKNNEEDIAESWIKYSSNTIIGLNLISDISQMIYLRYNDEFSKDIERVNSNSELKSDLQEKISNVLLIELESNVLLRIYSEISLQGLFNYSEKGKTNIKNIIEIENHLIFLLSLFFKPNMLEGSLIKISKIMAAINESVQKQRLLTLLEKSDDQKDKSNEIIGNAYETQARYYSENLGPFIKKINQTWWWQDHIVSYFIYQQGLQYYSNTINHYQNSTQQEIQSKLERIKLISLPHSKTSSEFAIAKHHYLIAIANAQNGLHNHGVKYFKLVISICDKVLADIGEFPVGEIMKNLYKNVIDTKQRSILLHGLSQINVHYRSLIKSISSENFKDAIQIALKVRKICDSLRGSIELKYISALPSTFESVASTAELMLSLEKNGSQILEQIRYFLYSFKTRIVTATNQIVESWSEFTDESDNENLKAKLNHKMIDIKLLYESCSMLPNSIEGREGLLVRLKCLENLAASINEDISAAETDEKNIVLELIHKSKAYFYAKVSYDLSKGVPKQDLPYNRILAHYSGSFISSRTVQMSIYQLTSQYLCLSEVLPSLFLSITQDQSLVKNKQESLKSISNSLNTNQKFKDMLSQIEQDCNILLDHKEKYGNIIAKVRWEQLTIRKSIVAGILKFYDSIVESIISSWASKLELWDDALLHIKNAQDLAFESSDILKNITRDDNNKENVATHVYSFAQFCQEGFNKINIKNSINIPAQQLFKLFRDMIFSI